MKKGKLNRRISIWRAESIDNGTATVQGEPVEIGQRWAAKRDISDGERLRSAQVGQELTTRFTVQSDALTRTITGADMIKCEGEPFYVIGTKETGQRRNEGIEITCSSTPDVQP